MTRIRQTISKRLKDSQNTYAMLTTFNEIDFKRAVVVDNKIEIRPMMYVALTYDHRLIDGREAVLFLVKVKNLIENPLGMLLE
jgi:pyruvate/2-oxoglutarate dehydrogenase complex dihydrolipoamide acyltransferase (E2) component